MKKLLLCICLSVAFIIPINAGKSYKTHFKAYHPRVTNLKPSWMTEHHSYRRQQNPFTGQKALQKAENPNKYYADRSYLNQYGLMLNIGFKNTEYPNYHSELFDGYTNSLLPSIGLNAFINLGSTQRNVGFLVGGTYFFSGLKRQAYDFVPEKKYNIVDYRVGVNIAKYVSVGFEGEYNGYFSDLQDEKYRVDKNHYGFYIMGMYKFSHYLGVNVDFSYIFNKQYYNYNLVYNRDQFYKQGQMTDYRLSVGLVVYF